MDIEKLSLKTRQYIYILIPSVVEGFSYFLLANVARSFTRMLNAYTHAHSYSYTSSLKILWRKDVDMIRLHTSSQYK